MPALRLCKPSAFRGRL